MLLGGLRDILGRFGGSYWNMFGRVFRGFRGGVGGRREDMFGREKTYKSNE